MKLTERRKCTHPGKSPTLPAWDAGRYRMNITTQNNNPDKKRFSPEINACNLDGSADKFFLFTLLYY
jgi:hypothetical protein